MELQKEDGPKLIFHPTAQASNARWPKPAQGSWCFCPRLWCGSRDRPVHTCPVPELDAALLTPSQSRNWIVTPQSAHLSSSGTGWWCMVFLSCAIPRAPSLTQDSGHPSPPFSHIICDGLSIHAHLPNRQTGSLQSTPPRSSGTACPPSRTPDWKPRVPGVSVLRGGHCPASKISNFQIRRTRAGSPESAPLLIFWN